MRAESPWKGNSKSLDGWFWRRSESLLSGRMEVTKARLEYYSVLVDSAGCAACNSFQGDVMHSSIIDSHWATEKFVSCPTPR